MSEIALTERGHYVLLKTLAGGAFINFKEVQIGNGDNAGTNAQAMGNALMELQINEATVVDDFIEMEVKFNNADVDSAFSVNEIGIFIDDPDEEGALLMYAYGFFEDSEADFIPTGTTRPIETSMKFLVYIGEAENVSATLSKSLVYASKDDLNAHIAEQNPHKTSKEDIGLGNVENVSVNNGTPTYTMASKLTNLTSGETIATAFGKIAKAVNDLINHIADNVKHVTATERATWNSKANSSHNHSASNITTGTLGIARGGTGATTAAAARTNIGAAATEHNHSASNITTGTLGIARGGTGITSLTGSDFSTSRVRGISFQSSVPDSVENGHIVFIYAS